MDTTTALLNFAKAFHMAQGTDVRCPTCNAAEGKWCHDTSVMGTKHRCDMLNNGRCSKRVASHAARLSAAR